MKEERTKLTLEQAEKLLPKTNTIHTFVNPRSSMLIGADWSRKNILDSIKKHGVELSGEQASRMGHGLVLWDGEKNIFIETIKTKNE